MSVETMNSLRLARTIQAERQEVWNAWTQPEHMKRWSCPAEGGVQDIASDFRVGGDFTITMEVDGQTHTAFGTYREIDEPHRLVYTWDWKEESHAMGATVVTVSFVEQGDATEVELVHEGFPAAEARDGHNEGWGACLMHLEALFA